MEKNARKRRAAKRAYDPVQTRGRIVSAAARQFTTRGYHATSMHDVMESAGVPAGSLYHYFPTKKSLGLAVIDEGVSAEVAQTWLEPLRTASCARAGVLRVFEAVADQIERDRRTVTGCPLNNLTLELSLADPDFQNSLKRIFETWTQTIAARILSDVAARTLRNRDPEGTAAAIVAAFSGAMSLAKAQQSAEPIRTCARHIRRLLEDR